MARKENETKTFHNENAVFLIALLSKVVGWVILAIYLLSWIGDLMQMAASGGMQLPPAAMDKLMFFANLVYPLAMGGFYFLIMHGLAQGLYVVMDLFESTEEEDTGD